jgi:hypothetical protein
MERVSVDPQYLRRRRAFFEVKHLFALKLTFNSIVGDNSELPPPAATEEADEELFADDAWVESPIHIDYGTNVKLGKNVVSVVILEHCNSHRI